MLYWLAHPKRPAGHRYNSVEAPGPRLGDLVELPEPAGLLGGQLVEAHHLLDRVHRAHTLHRSDALDILQILDIFYLHFVTKRSLKTI